MGFPSQFVSTSRNAGRDVSEIEKLQAKLDNCVAQEDFWGADAAQKELQNLADVTHPSDAAQKEAQIAELRATI